MSTAIYPGSFDPVTLGHLDIIKRSAAIFDHVVIGVLNNTAKKPLFSLEERVNMLKDAVSGIDNVSVESFEGLLVDFVKQKNTNVIISRWRRVIVWLLLMWTLFSCQLAYNIHILALV